MKRFKCLLSVIWFLNYYASLNQWKFSKRRVLQFLFNTLVTFHGTYRYTNFSVLPYFDVSQRYFIKNKGVVNDFDYIEFNLGWLVFHCSICIVKSC